MLRKLTEVLCFLLLPSLAYAQYFGEETSTPSSWSMGIKVSASLLDGDVDPQNFGKQGSLFFEKTISRIIDVRIEANIGQTFGQNLFASNSPYHNQALNGNLNPEVQYDSASLYFHNYQHTYGSLGVSFKLNINRIFTVLGGERWDLYLLGGFGAYGYETRINALNEFGQLYNFDRANSSSISVRQENLYDLLDNTYESMGDQDQINSTFLGPYTLKTFFQSGGGIRFHLTDALGLGLEGNYLFFGDDLLDGQQWQEDGQQSLSRDKLLSLGLLIDLAF
ncbi:MAG: hypothetical protein R8P61_19030 [Bacteroidia bacterium]|nr:hypothetical protein [Bacteroidia bacterium]